MQDKIDAFVRLLKVMDDLREKCPWDREQTMKSLRNLTIEETYELADAVLDDDQQGVKEEIGDLMLHMIFYAKIAEERGEFDIADALNAECDKLIHRHPHVYGDLSVENAEVVKQNWEELKLREGKRSVLAGVPDSLPAMVKAYRMQEKTKQVGFEWDHIEDVWAKVQEEIAELQDVLQSECKMEKKEEEFGDVLFSLINYGRYLGIEAESALARVNNKFKRRFEFIEKKAVRPLKEMTLGEMDNLWEEAKLAE